MSKRDRQVGLLAEAIRECAEDPMSAEDWAEALHSCGVRIKRCLSMRHTEFGDRRCDLRRGHGGQHIRNDGLGRPEYFWEQQA